MSNNPVQIVLNTQNYVVANNKPPGGGHKDFYAGRDEDFKDHKQNLIDEIQYLKSSKMLKDTKLYMLLLNCNQLHGLKVINQQINFFL